MKSKSTFLLGVSAAAMLCCFTTSAYAQSEGAVTEIVVTGSRIVRNGFQAPTPTTVASAEELSIASPASLSEGLNKLPIFNGSGGQGGGSNRGLGSGGVVGTGNFLNLRNFGANRTLILLDGHRVPPTSFDGSVDVGTLPEALVQRVDVVTGGASAVYGSDAVTGVVNYVLDHRFKGVKGVIQGGISDRSDGQAFRTNIAFGTSVFDRGHFLLSLDYSNDVGVKTKERRGWYNDLMPLLGGNGSASNPYRIVPNGRANTSAFGGLIVGGPLGGLTFNPDGTLRPFNLGVATGTTGIGSGGDGTYHADTSLLSSLLTKQGFSRFQYELTDTVTAFVQVAFSEGRTRHTQATANRSSGSTNRIVIFSGNAFLRPEVQSVLTSTNTPSFVVSSYGLDYGRPTFDNLTTGLSGTVGLTGRLADRFNWDITYIHGDGRTRNTQERNSNNPRFYAAVDAVRNPANGQVVCRVTLTNPGLFPGCVPINPLGRFNASQEAINYTTQATGWQAVNTIDDISANITGDVFNTWAGPVSLAVGAEYRKQRFRQETSNDPTVAANFAGLRGGFSATTIEYVGVLVTNSKGANSVSEANAEVVVPLATNMPLAQSLELNGAIRYADYSNSGGATTWKIGLNYQPVADLRFRLVRSRDIRAPTLYDLYAGQQVRNSGFVDVLTNVNSTAQERESGNPDLSPEVADTLTGGFIYSPSWLPRFTVSADYYSIKIDNAIGSIGIADSTRECIASGGASPLCSLAVRPFPITNTTAANFPTTIFTRPVNVAEAYTRGVDMEASYNSDLADLGLSIPGAIDVRLLASYQPVRRSRNFAAAPLRELAGVAGSSTWRLNVRGTYRVGPLTASVQTRWNNGGVWNADRTLIYAEPNFGTYAITDISGSYKFTVMEKELTGFVNVSNLFDRDPQILPSTANPGQVTPVVGGNDIRGRYYTAGIRFRF